MKTLKYIILILVVGSIISCSDFLKEEMKTGVSADTYYTTEQGFEDAVEAAYMRFTNYVCLEWHYTLTTFGTDAFTHGADGDFHAFNHYDGALTGASQPLEDTWQRLYRAINQCNAVVDRAPNVPMDNDLRLNRIGEARWLRSYAYFTITRFWGRCHLTLDETLEPIYTVNWVEQEVVFDSIIADLNWVINNSGLTSVPSQPGRVTTTAAQMLLGHVYLRRAWSDFSPNRDEDLRLAEELFTEVIETGNYSIESDVLTLWGLEDWPNSVSLEGSDANSEVIFAFQADLELQRIGEDRSGHRGHLYFKMPYDLEPGMLRDIWNGRPWRRFSPTDYQLQSWDRSIDSRFDKLYKRVWYCNDPVGGPKWNQSDADAGYCTPDQVGQPKFTLGDTAFYFPGPGEDDEWTDERKAASRFKVYTRNEYNLTHFPELLKFYDPYRLGIWEKYGSRDKLVYRLSEAYLFRAEVRHLRGNDPGAAEDINIIRRRAAWKDGEVKGTVTYSNTETQMEITAADVDIDFILDERLRELFGEGQRWFDLQRTGNLVERVRLHCRPYIGTEDYESNIQDYHTLRPIPQSIIDAAINRDEIEGGMQNPGYPGAK